MRQDILRAADLIEELAKAGGSPTAAAEYLRERFSQPVLASAFQQIDSDRGIFSAAEQQRYTVIKTRAWQDARLAIAGMAKANGRRGKARRNPAAYPPPGHVWEIRVTEFPPLSEASPHVHVHRHSGDISRYVSKIVESGNVEYGQKLRRKGNRIQTEYTDGMDNFYKVTIEPVVERSARTNPLAPFHGQAEAQLYREGYDEVDYVGKTKAPSGRAALRYTCRDHSGLWDVVVTRPHGDVYRVEVRERIAGLDDLALPNPTYHHHTRRDTPPSQRRQAHVTADPTNTQPGAQDPTLFVERRDPRAHEPETKAFPIIKIVSTSWVPDPYGSKGKQVTSSVYRAPAGLRAYMREKVAQYRFLLRDGKRFRRLSPQEIDSWINQIDMNWDSFGSDVPDPAAAAPKHGASAAAKPNTSWLARSEELLPRSAYMYNWTSDPVAVNQKYAVGNGKAKARRGKSAKSAFKLKLV
jgi:hypothetical protein